MKKRVADIIADYLSENGLNQIFSVTGGGAMHLNDAFGRHPKLNCLYNHHEQACAMGAEGYTRLSGKTAVVCVTSGPGGTNALTGVMGAWLDSIPMLVISGQMKYITTIASTDVPLRQLGFQEYNILDSVKPMTKYCVMVKESKDVLYYLKKAKYIAESGRPGPVWIDIPLDVQGEKIEEDSLRDYDSSEDDAVLTPLPTSEQINHIIEKISNAKRPLILAGNGIRISHSVELFREVIKKYNIPVVTAWNAHDIIKDDDPLFAGRPGTIGTRGGNFVVQNCDVLISLGCRMSIRQISYQWENFAKHAYKISVDIDEAELKKPTLNIDYPIHADVKDVLNELRNFEYASNTIHNEWIKWCKDINNKYPIVLKDYYEYKSPISPYVFMKKLSEELHGDDAVIASNGTACVCGLQVIDIKDEMRMFTNAGASSMGYGITAAIGASLYDRSRRIVCLEGDGSVQMNIQEFQTITHHKLNVKLFWLNNDGYHSIRQTQSSTFNGDKNGYCGVNSESGLSFPEAEKIAYAYGIPFCKIESVDDLNKISSFLNDYGPGICEVMLDKNQFFAPKLSSKVNPDGTIVSPSLEDMYPFLPREELCENMISER